MEITEHHAIAEPELISSSISGYSITQTVDCGRHLVA
jgi:hypothetical protein